jgi:hypothetical protein
MKKIKQILAISFAYKFIVILISVNIFHGITNSLALTSDMATMGWISSNLLLIGNSLFKKKINLNF